MPSPQTISSETEKKYDDVKMPTLFQFALYECIRNSTELSKYCMQLLIVLHDHGCFDTRNELASWTLSKLSWTYNTALERTQLRLIISKVHQELDTKQVNCIIVNIVNVSKLDISNSFGTKTKNDCM